MKNLQANSLSKWMHQVLSILIWVQEIEIIDFNKYDPFGRIVASWLFALRATVHTLQDTTPAQLVYGQEMVMHVDSIKNWGAM